MIARVADVGQRLTDQVEGFGRFTRFTGTTLLWMLAGVSWSARPSVLTPQLYKIGTLSIPVVALQGLFVGMVLSIETYTQFSAIGQEVRLGGVVAMSVVKQIGPVMAAIMLAGRVGSSVSAELGTMRVTEQLDALRAMGSDPIAYLVAPRVVACILMIPVLTIFSDLTGIFGGYLINVRAYGINAEAYWDFTERFVAGWDVTTGLAKSVFFGGCIGLISCYKGFHCESGAEGVGKAATDAFVASFVAIVISNFFLAKFLNDVYYLIYGHDGPSAFTG